MTTLAIAKMTSMKRLWVLVRLNNIKVALGVAYFPNDGTNKPKTDELFFELLENTSSFASSGYEMILMGDLNGRSLGGLSSDDKNDSTTPNISVLFCCKC
jgi:hypothetical protein